MTEHIVRRLGMIVAVGLVAGGVLTGRLRAADGPPVGRLKAPAGFTVEVYATGVTLARQMTVAPSGTVFVGAMRLGPKAGNSIHALVDRNKDHAVDEVVVVATGLEMPNGVAFHKGALYVAEMTRILRFDDVEKHLGQPQTPKVVIDKVTPSPNARTKSTTPGHALDASSRTPRSK